MRLLKQFESLFLFWLFYPLLGLCESTSQNSTLLLSADGQIVPEVLINIDLKAYEEYMNAGNTTGLSKRDGNSNWYSVKLWNGTSTQDENGLDIFDKRLNRLACVALVEGAGRCIEMVKSFWEGVLDVVFKIKQAATGKDCRVHCGWMGTVYYKYWNAGGDCDTTAQVKTIAGAIDAVLKEESGMLRNTYCITMRHNGTWVGHLKIGLDSLCGSGGCSQYDVPRCYDAGCGSLQGGDHSC